MTDHRRAAAARQRPAGGTAAAGPGRHAQARRAAAGRLPRPRTRPRLRAGEARLYQPGDDVRRIDWNVTARMQDTHVRETIADRELESWLLVDLSPSLDFGTAELREARPRAGRGRCRRVPHRPRRQPPRRRAGHRRRPGHAAGPQRSPAPDGGAAPHRHRAARASALAADRSGRGHRSARGDDAPAGARCGDLRLPRIGAARMGAGAAPALGAARGARHRSRRSPRARPARRRRLLTLVDPETGDAREVQTVDAAARSATRPPRPRSATTIARSHPRRGRRPPRAAHRPRLAARHRPLRLPCGRQPGRAHPDGDAADVPRRTTSSPGRLWWLLAVAAAAVALRRACSGAASDYAVRFTNMALLDSVAPRRPGWRRHVPRQPVHRRRSSASSWRYARPADEVRVPRERATVILAIDTRCRWRPTTSPRPGCGRQGGRRAFIDEVPEKINVGLVSSTASPAIAGAADHRPRPVRHAHRPTCELGRGHGHRRGDLRLARRHRARPAGARRPGRHRCRPPSCCMSDGETTVGRPNEEGVAAAPKPRVPVSTIAFGTQGGTIVVPGEGVTVPVPVNRAAPCAASPSDRRHVLRAPRRSAELADGVRGHRLVDRLRRRGAGDHGRPVVGISPSLRCLLTRRPCPSPGSTACPEPPPRRSPVEQCRCVSACGDDQLTERASESAASSSRR